MGDKKRKKFGSENDPMAIDAARVRMVRVLQGVGGRRHCERLACQRIACSAAPARVLACPVRLSRLTGLCLLPPGTRGCRRVGGAAVGLGRAMGAQRPVRGRTESPISYAAYSQAAAKFPVFGGGLASALSTTAGGPARVAAPAWLVACGARSVTSQLTLSDLKDNPGARKKKVRVGRGIGSGKGKTAGRGHKGQLSRAGNNGRLGFEGGQTPITRRHPKRGFNNPRSYLSALQPLNLDRLVRYVKAGRLDVTKTITMKHLRDCGCVGHKINKGIKLLAKNSADVDLGQPIHIQVSDVSQRARDVIEKAGGSVQVSYFNGLALRALLKPEKFESIPRLAAPPPRLMWKYPLHYQDVEAQLLAKAKK